MGRTVIRDNTSGTAPLPVVATAAQTTNTIYARIPSAQTFVKAAVYTDNVIATATY
ncbi:fimbrial major subunit CsuA/B family protein [Glaciimonas immobilis]|nr:fimbrial major subunit CsuA/B family protein [Glaciimonas immobilis]